MTFKIVYLDDEPDLVDVFIDFFSSSNVEIKGFSVPEEAKKYLQEHPVDLVFFDYRMPGITGDQLALDLNLSVPFVLITGDIEVKTKFPFKMIFRKPYEIQKIGEFINLCLHSQKNK